MTTAAGPFAIVTDASARIGHELAKACSENGFDLMVADQPKIGETGQEVWRIGAGAEPVQAARSAALKSSPSSTGARQRPAPPQASRQHVRAAKAGECAHSDLRCSAGLP